AGTAGPFLAGLRCPDPISPFVTPDGRARQRSTNLQTICSFLPGCRDAPRCAILAGAIATGIDRMQDRVRITGTELLCHNWGRLSRVSLDY
ncbi:hypothetical protein, partial [Enterococcus faecium]